jgi:hypothetical protein
VITTVITDNETQRTEIKCSERIEIPGSLGTLVTIEAYDVRSLRNMLVEFKQNAEAALERVEAVL